MSYSTSSNVPIEMLPGLGLRTAKVLRSWNIRTIGQFKQLPERVLVELFGPSIRSVYGHVHNKKYVRRVAMPKVTPTQRLNPNGNLSFFQKLRLATTVLNA